MAAEDVVGCETLVAREPDYADLRNDAARLYLELGQPQRALTHFAAVRRCKPQSRGGALQRRASRSKRSAGPPTRRASTRRRSSSIRTIRSRTTTSAA